MPAHDVDRIAAKLTPLQRQALLDGEPDMFDVARITTGRAIGGLRRKGIVAGKHLTALGAEVLGKIRG
jgi:hypothetical protein